MDKKMSDPRFVNHLNPDVVVFVSIHCTCMLTKLQRLITRIASKYTPKIDTL